MAAPRLFAGIPMWVAGVVTFNALVLVTVL